MTAATPQLGRPPESISLFRPPRDPLLAAIPPEVRDEWRWNPTQELIWRLEGLCACGPRPSSDSQAVRLMFRRARRAAWETYVYCAFACGLLEGERGIELRGRLASSNADDFRSAMAECLTCWFLAGRLGLPVTGDAPGRKGKNLDMTAFVGGQGVGVEVKAPHRDRPTEGEAWWGHDADLLARCLDRANRQFPGNGANVLAVVPELRTPVSLFRVQLVTALYGQEVITFPVDTRTGSRAGPVTTQFRPDGRLLRRRQPSGAFVKADGTPGFTRVSAVIVIEEVPRDLGWSRNNEAWIDHNVLVAHNPHARHPLSPDLFREYVQFTDMGSGYGWSDGARL